MPNVKRCVCVLFMTAGESFKKFSAAKSKKNAVKSVYLWCADDLSRLYWAPSKLQKPVLMQAVAMLRDHDAQLATASTSRSSTSSTDGGGSATIPIFHRNQSISGFSTQLDAKQHAAKLQAARAAVQSNSMRFDAIESLCTSKSRHKSTIKAFAQQFGAYSFS